MTEIDKLDRASQAYVERALELPQGSLRDDEFLMKPETKALIKVIAQFPWIITVADAKFKPNIAQAELLRAAADLIEKEGADEANKMDRIYTCGHCGYTGPCYGAPTSAGVSAPWCKECERNDKLTRVKQEAKDGVADRNKETI